MNYRKLSVRFMALAMTGILAFPGQVMAEETAVQESVTEAVVEAAETDPPQTDPPQTDPPQTDPPETNPPETDPPQTDPPETNPPETEAPVTEPETTAPTESVSENGTESDQSASETTQMTEQIMETESDTEKETDTEKESETETEVDREAILKDYEKSRLFSELKNRMKYSVTVPIDGIPSFITQEMVVGALKCQDEYGFPASVTIAQIIAESGYGNYGPGGDSGQGLSQLAYEYCNLFGIKGSGTAGSVEMQTWEMKPNGSTYTTSAGFRAYYTYTECINDRAELLKSGYSDLTDGVTDANTFAVQVGSRWATDAYYGKRLISIMEQYDLYRLDDMTLTDFSALMGRFANPCPGAQPTSGFGYRDFDKSFHKGLDLGTGSENIPTYAAEAGTVTYAAYDETAGNMVIIDHGDGLVTKYMHHSELYVKAGDHVEKGQQIGLSGTTGDSTGNHLHFQVEENGVPVDPAEYLLQESSAEAPAASEETRQSESEKETSGENEDETEKQTETETVVRREDTKKEGSDTTGSIFTEERPFSAGTILTGNTVVSGGTRLNGAAGPSEGTKLPEGTRLSGGTKLLGGTKLSAGTKLSGGTLLSGGIRLSSGTKLSAGKGMAQGVTLSVGDNINIPVTEVVLISLWPLGWMIF